MAERSDGKTSPRLYRPPRAADPGDTPIAPQSRKARAPGIDVEYVLDRPGSRDRTAFEVWTKSRIYHVDATLKCIAIVMRETSEPDADTRLVGAQLAGGETRRSEEGLVDLYYPLPVPGCIAVFNDTTRYRKIVGHTSRVERVVLRVRKARVRDSEADESWDSVTGRFRS